VEVDMRVLGPFCFALALVPAAFAADTVTCTDADSEITLVYTLDADLSVPITRVDMQLTGDFGLSTDAGHADHDGEFVSAAFIGDDVEGAEVSWTDESGGAHRALSFRIGRVFEAQSAMVGGVIAVSGGGLWTITCRSSDLGQ
jgi:hypothetical protein